MAFVEIQYTQETEEAWNLKHEYLGIVFFFFSVMEYKQQFF